ncbi:hypothetical protein O0L34_g12816 [Tuta absoluta]|nr:hypothetical protein O0L34_g12816 [Tuta absoluta]
MMLLCPATTRRHFLHRYTIGSGRSLVNPGSGFESTNDPMNPGFTNETHMFEYMRYDKSTNNQVNLVTWDIKSTNDPMNPGSLMRLTCLGICGMMLLCPATTRRHFLHRYTIGSGRSLVNPESGFESTNDPMNPGFTNETHMFGYMRYDKSTNNQVNLVTWDIKSTNDPMNPGSLMRLTCLGICGMMLLCPATTRRHFLHRYTIGSGRSLVNPGSGVESTNDPMNPGFTNETHMFGYMRYDVGLSGDDATTLLTPVHHRVRPLPGQPWVWRPVYERPDEPRVH